MSVDHYENFPVASWLCPAELRPAITALYRYARTADDIADEGHASPLQRLAELARYRQALVQSLEAAPCSAPHGARLSPPHNPPHNPDPQASATDWPEVFGPLVPVVRRHALSVHLLLDLLEAFEQDVRNPPYPDRASLLDYCRRSANPVGRLLLQLWAIDDEPSREESDAICTALQLINFWQDFSIDHARGRCYVPHEDARAHGLHPRDVTRVPDGGATQSLIRDLCAWAEELMLRGSALALRVPGRSGWELRLVVQGGLRILEKIALMDHRTLHRRPRLHAWDVPLLMWRALRMTRTPSSGSPAQDAAKRLTR